ncbi:MAG: hypothetical protein R3B72_04005 [Polyangiaceae bacterium]
MTLRRAGLLVVGLTSAGCAEPEAPAEASLARLVAGTPMVAPPPEQIRELEAITTAEERAASVAFDLVGSPRGALVVWADEALHLQELDRGGRAVGDARVISPAGEGPIQEVVAARSGDRHAVLWSRRDATGERSSAWVSEGGIEALGPTVVTAGRQLALTGDGDGGFLALARGPDEACHDSDAEAGRCATFAIHRLGEAGAPRPLLALPNPCHDAVAGFVATAGRWHYAVCNRSGPKPVTTLFTAQRSPSYAEASELFAGCLDVRALRLGERIWLVGRCAGVRRVTAIEGLARVVEARAWEDVTARCEGERLTLQAGELRLEVEAGADGLAPLLPEGWVSERGRAVWTGDHLLLAQESADLAGPRRSAMRCHEGALR